MGNYQLERLIKKKEELERTMAAIDSLQEKIIHLSKGEKVVYTMDEYDVLLDLSLEAKRMMDKEARVSRKGQEQEGFYSKGTRQKLPPV